MWKKKELELIFCFPSFDFCKISLIIEWIGEDSNLVTKWNIIKESKVRFGKIEVGAVVDVEWEDETSPAKIVKISGRYMESI